MNAEHILLEFDQRVVIVILGDVMDVRARAGPLLSQRRGRFLHRLRIAAVVAQEQDIGEALRLQAVGFVREHTAAKYPVTCRAFFSQYGSGRNIWLWLGPSEEAYLKAPSVDSVIESQLGHEKAAALLARWRAGATDRRERTVQVRVDLSTPDSLVGG